jgi:regulator of sigma E protease
MARRVGMRVESFGIGFGKPIFSFMRNGVKWNICWLPFGGYVKIAGMEKEEGKEPEEIKDGFFGKSPWARIKVAIMGPLVNIVFALFLFFCLWASGGREKHYADITPKIGWLDPNSQLYQKGIRPGDVILSYDKEPVHAAKDHFHAAMTGGKVVHVEGMRYDTVKNSYVPFSLDIQPYTHPQALEPGILTTGVLAPASFIVFPSVSSGRANALPHGSPLENSGITHGDRIVWVDGEPIYSLNQISSLINEAKALLTIKRDGKMRLVRVPRVAVEELKLPAEPKEELTDWQYEADLKAKPFDKLLFIPYNLTPDCKVEHRLEFIDSDKEAQAFPKVLYSDLDAPLHAGDHIVAIDGMPISESFQLLSQLQTHKVLVITQRKNMPAVMESFDNAERDFDVPLYSKDLAAIVASIGSSNPLESKGNLYLLAPVVPKTRRELFQSPELAERAAAELEEEKRHIQAIDDPEKRVQALKFLEVREKQLLLGLPGVTDQAVSYNPTPFRMFQDIVEEVVHTLSALVGGYLNPKWLSGPVGIVQVIQHQWMAGIKEALFWIGAISLNLGLLNLLPLPVLDGGYICLSLFEIVTGKRLKSKTIEKIVVPFAVLLISFLIFLTYHDLIRILSSFIKW